VGIDAATVQLRRVRAGRNRPDRQRRPEHRAQGDGHHHAPGVDHATELNPLNGLVTLTGVTVQ
jgi:hypothetical protein